MKGIYDFLVMFSEKLEIRPQWVRFNCPAAWLCSEITADERRFGNSHTSFFIEQAVRGHDGADNNRCFVFSIRKYDVVSFFGELRKLRSKTVCTE